MLSYNLGDAVMKKYMSDGLKGEYDAWTIDRINARLREMDERNHSYTEQDPWSVRASYAAFQPFVATRSLAADQPIAADQPRPATLLFTSGTSTPLKMVCTLRELTSKTECAVRSGDDLWVIKAKAGTRDVPLEEIRFDLERNPAGHTSQQQCYKDCMLQIL